MVITFDAYQSALVQTASVVDDLYRGDAPLLWRDSMTARVIEILTRDDADVIECAFDGALDDDEIDDDIDAETIRDGQIECAIDDMVCALPNGYRIGYSAAGLPLVMLDPDAPIAVGDRVTTITPSQLRGVVAEVVGDHVVVDWEDAAGPQEDEVPTASLRRYH